jgi:TolB-like protein/Tfp pilus assembly protein PilF
MRIDELFAELKKRNVYRATAAYIVAGGFAIQVLTASAPHVGIPEFWVTTIIWALFIAFPFVVAFSWAFDITLSGIKRAGETDPGEAITHKLGNKFTYILAGLGAAGFVLLLWQVFFAAPKIGAPGGNAISIAVLPLQNLSRGADDAYLADAFHDAITRRLSRSPGIRMASRESTSAYRSPDSDPSLTSKQLGATVIVEGGVEKIDDEIRIDIRLINTKESSKPLSYPIRGSVDNFSDTELQIAKTIAEALKLDAKSYGTLLHEDKLTTNPEAARSFLRGIALARPATTLDSDYFAAVKAFRQAVALDSYFVAAWAELARCCAVLDVEDSENRGAWANDAQTACNKASQLQPDGTRTLLAQGYIQWLVFNDYNKAKANFGRAWSQVPVSAEIPQLLALAARPAGRWDECLARFEEIMRNDPGNLFILKKLAYTNEAMRRFPTATELFNKGLTMAADDRSLLTGKIEVCHATGDLSTAGKLLANLVVDADDESSVGLHFEQLWLQRRFGDAVKLMNDVMKTLYDKADFGFLYNKYRFQRGMAEQAEGNALGANVDFTRALEELQALQATHPKDVDYARWLAQVYAKLDKKDDAIREAEEAVKLSPTSRDAYNGPIGEVNRALVETWTGDLDRAVVELERLIAVPSNGCPPITATLLRIDARWDPLRGVKRFQRIYEGQ